MTDSITRSGSNYSVPRDANRVPFMVAASTADGVTPIVLEADPTSHLLQVSSSAGGLVDVDYDSLTYTNTSSTVDTYTYYLGGLSGTIVATVTITYTDSTKSVLSSVVRT